MKPLPALLLLFALLGLTCSLVTPAFEAPDEVWHYAYLRYVAEARALPALDDDASGAYQEVAQPPLYYLAAAPLSGLVSDDDLDELTWHNPGFGYQAGGTVNDNKNMLIHTDRERFPWRGAVLALRLARLVSLAFGLLAVVAAWGLGSEAFPDRPAAALMVAALVALTPQFLFISGVASNDSAAAALSTAALWAMARALNRGVTPRRAALAGLLVGLAASAKTSGLLLLPLALAAVTLGQAAGQRRSLGQRALAALTTAAAAALTGSAWYLRNALRYGDPLALSLHIDTPWGRAAPASLPVLLAELPRVFRSYWGAFGWGHVEFPPWVYGGLLLFLLPPLVGWGRALGRRRLPGRPAVLLLAAGWGVLIAGALLQWMRQVEAPHGRLLFPAIAAFAVLVVGGWQGLPAISSRWIARLSLLTLAALAILAPWLVIRPAFAPPRLVAPPAAMATVRPLNWRYENGARLLGVALDRPSVAPGGTLAVRACWEAVTPIASDDTVFVHLVGRANARVAERYTYPGLGRFPTSLWPVGAAFCDTYRLHVGEWAPAPELYDVVIGFYDSANERRLEVQDAAGNPIDLAAVAQVRVAPAQPLTVNPQQPLDYRLGDAITLTGYDLAGGVAPGGVLTVTLFWRADAAPPGSYTAFVHLLDEAGQVIAQHDGLPRYGRYPTSAWQAGDVVPDEHVLYLPAAAPGGPVRLVAGMYHPATLERLPAVGPAGRAPDDLIPLGDVRSSLAVFYHQVTKTRRKTGGLPAWGSIRVFYHSG